MLKYYSNQLWDSILSSDIFRDIDIETFKNDDANNKITQYNTNTHGILFFKNIIFIMTNSFSKENLELLNKIPNRHIGGGINIHYGGITCDLDYLLSLDEAIFLKDILKNITSILEIGAGYGRTCHTILSLFENIQEYVIVDLDKMLNLSQKYLAKVLDKNNFAKIKFVKANTLSSQDKIFDLIINIDSMQEMDSITVQNYLLFIGNNSYRFFTKNMLGKFEPSLFGWQKTQNSEMALNSGILKEIINIFCPQELDKARNKFLEVFCPANDWLLQKHSTPLP